jgi:Zn-dependent protease
MTIDSLSQIILYAIPVILAVTFHEAAHGFVALYFGDQTAKEAGRVTLNPFRHVDLFGTIILPLLLIVANAGFIFGYAKPVPVNFGALRNPRWDMVWVAAAGPAMNMALALISALSLYAAGVLDGENGALLGNLLLFSIELNIVLAIFNMLPLPPLDGSKVIAAFLPGSLMRPYLNFGRYGMTVLLLLLIVLPLLSYRAGIGLDIFGVLVTRPAATVMHALLALVGRG